MFSLTAYETISLALKLGIVSTEKRTDTKAINHGFSAHFKHLLSTYSYRISKLCADARIDERVFRYIRAGQHLTKKPILALLIVMGLDVSQIQKALSKAGFVLSPAVDQEVVVLWMLRHESAKFEGYKRLEAINETLEALVLPRLTE